MFQCISNAVVQKQLIGSNDPGVCEVPKSWLCDRVGRAVIDIRIESVHNGTESTYILVVELQARKMRRPSEYLH